MKKPPTSIKNRQNKEGTGWFSYNLSSIMGSPHSPSIRTGCSEGSLAFDLLKVVLRIRNRIRIHRIHMFLGLPDPDPLGRVMDPDPDPSIIMQK